MILRRPSKEAMMSIKYLGASLEETATGYEYIPNDSMVRVYLDSLLTTVLGNPEGRLCLTMNFNRSYPSW